MKGGYVGLMNCVFAAQKAVRSLSLIFTINHNLHLQYRDTCRTPHVPWDIRTLESKLKLINGRKSLLMSCPYRPHIRTPPHLSSCSKHHI